MTDDVEEDEWQLWWDARLVALERVFGKCEDQMLISAVPFFLGFDCGGAATILRFKHHIPGTVYVTSELIGAEDQVPNELGNYELMICHRDSEEWGPNIIRHLAYYTLDCELGPRHTMDIGPSTPEGSTIAAFLFLEYARFHVREKSCGVLLCLGITREELEVINNDGVEAVVKALKNAGVYPYTDLYRESVV